MSAAGFGKDVPVEQRDLSREVLPVVPAEQSDQAQDEPVKVESAKAEPVKAEPVKSKPEPVKSESVQSESVQSEPVKPEPVTPDEVRDQVRQARADLGETMGRLAMKADVPAQARRRAARAEVMARDTVARAAELIRAQSPQRVWAAARRTVDTGNRGSTSTLVAGSAGAVAAAAVWLRFRRPRRR